MRYSILLLPLLLALNTHAQDSATTRDSATTHDTTITRDSTTTHDSKPWDYIMMKNGHLIEVTKGQQKPVTANVILVNESTIHPNGTINASSGRTKHLKEGQYITMDGRIRKLKKLPANLAAE